MKRLASLTMLCTIFQTVRLRIGFHEYWLGVKEIKKKRKANKNEEEQKTNSNSIF